VLIRPSCRIEQYETLVFVCACTFRTVSTVFYCCILENGVGPCTPFLACWCACDLGSSYPISASRNSNNLTRDCYRILELWDPRVRLEHAEGCAVRLCVVYPTSIDSTTNDHLLKPTIRAEGLSIRSNKILPSVHSIWAVTKMFSLCVARRAQCQQNLRLWRNIMHYVRTSCDRNSFLEP
jgi:hypothetical protein